MLTMSDINTIRNLRNSHDKSINSIRKELNINWCTAKKYADDEHLPRVLSNDVYDEKVAWIIELLESEQRYRDESKKFRLYKIPNEKSYG